MHASGFKVAHTGEDPPRAYANERPGGLTVHAYAERTARHERAHVKQIVKARAALAG